MVGFITTPTHRWLEEHLEHCVSRFLVASPYVTSFLPKLTNRLIDVDSTLVTRTDLRDFALGASDIEAVCDLCRRGTKVLSLARLHAKAYVIDSTHALVTSANATHGGMFRNWEFGVAIDDQSEVNKIADILLGGFGAPQRPQSWKTDELEKLRGPIKVFRDQLPPVPAVPEFETSGLPAIKIDRGARESLMVGLPGWSQLTLEGVLALKADIFTIRDVYRRCLPLAAARFPGNKHPREKLRQQLQRLRDLGLVDFLGGGNYRRTVEPK